MGQQHRKVTKRKRRSAYIRRRKEQSLVGYATASIPMARRVVPAGEEVVTEVIRKAPVKKAPAKKEPSPQEVVETPIPQEG